ncbi:MAG: histidine kinase [Timaviella obliquedivisa GSE-PSE-MK23-08B]|jgi:signal transduction histidine kinase|nr:histidine kinase [Timaviella obliquedivisa GSE-PSE-MK23-08B]
MNPSRSPDVALYELATSLEPTPQTLQISPTTFKSLVGIVLDLLLEHNIAATIWLKLPKGEVWQSEIERFCQSAIAPHTVYSLHTYQERVKTNTHVPPAASRLSADWNGLDTLDLNTGTPVAILEETSQVYNLPLAAESQLKREYFITVVSNEFCGSILAHRPRSLRPRAEGNGMDLPDPKLGTDDSLEQKHPLFGMLSFDPAIVQMAIEGINQAIRYGQPASRSDAEIKDLLVGWEQLLARGVKPTLNPKMVSNLLAKQVQRQEEIWRSGAAQRRQADSALVLRQANEDLLKTLQQKDEFIKNLGQELRTPLTTMKTALSLLNSPTLKPQQRQRYMEMLSRECDRQGSLIAGVLDLVQIESSPDSAPMESLRLSEIIPGVVSTYQPLAQEKGIMLAYTIPEDLPPISCFSQGLKQIAINLLHNSIKFTASGGQVWVRAKQQGDTIQLEFRDTGIGIVATEVPKVFDRFYRIRQGGDDGNGVGLGLAIVQQLLVRCGGSISVRSKLGEGSAFCVTLPIERS